MATLSNGKRRCNVRTSSSCSSIESVENILETGYVSDNSTSDNDIYPRKAENKAKRGFSNVDTNDPLSDFNVLKKQFVLRAGKTANDSDEGICYQPSRKQPKCFSKNAVMARLNRMKKKQHLENMEKRIEELSEENSLLKEQAKGHDELVRKLSDEVQYLKSVLANSKEIGMLLKSVKSNSGLPVTSSLESCILPASEMVEPFDCDFSEDPLLSCNFGLLSDDGTNVEQCVISENHLPEEGTSPTDYGICFHVSNKKVSLELCPSCHTNAVTSWERNS